MANDQSAGQGAEAPHAPSVGGEISNVVRAAVAAVGVAALTGGAVAVFVTKNGAGAAALITAGTVALLVSMFANRIHILEGAGVKMELAVASTLQAAEEAERSGRPELAASLRNHARVLRDLAHPLATQYEDVRRSVPSSWERTATLERIVREWADIARRHEFEPRDVEMLFDTGEDGSRVGALAMMYSVPELASHRVATMAITQPRSAFEQYHALKVAETLAVHQPSDPATRALGDVVRALLHGGRFGEQKSDRCNLAEHILSLLPPPAEHP